jgi:heptosyltransferase-2
LEQRNEDRTRVKIIVFCPNWVGDLVMATPALRALRLGLPDARIVGLARPSVVETLAGSHWFDDLITYHHRSKIEHERSLPVIRRLRREAFDAGLLLTNSIRTALLGFLGGVRRRIGYENEGRGFLLSESLPAPPGWKTPAQEPIVDSYIRLAERLGVHVPSRQLELSTTPADEALADRLWGRIGWSREEPVVVLNPGGAFGPAKRWPSRYFAELARRLVDQQRVKVLVLCGPSERGFARFIADASLRPRQVHSMAEEEVSLGLSKAVVRRATLLITTDSGPRHFGAAFGVPTVSLFGPTHMGWTETYFEAETKLQHAVPCGPCQQRECPLGHHRCMTDLTVDEVYSAGLRRLEARSKRAG